MCSIVIWASFVAWAQRKSVWKSDSDIRELMGPAAVYWLIL